MIYILSFKNDLVKVCNCSEKIYKSKILSSIKQKYKEIPEIIIVSKSTNDKSNWIKYFSNAEVCLNTKQKGVSKIKILRIFSLLTNHNLSLEDIAKKEKVCLELVSCIRFGYIGNFSLHKYSRKRKLINGRSRDYKRRKKLV